MPAASPARMVPTLAEGIPRGLRVFEGLEQCLDWPSRPQAARQGENVAIETVIDRGRNLVVHKMTEAIDQLEVSQALETVYGDPKSTRMAVLWDARDADLSVMSHDDAWEMAGAVERFYGKMGSGKTAFLTSRKVDFGVARMLQSLIDAIPRDLQVFDNLEEALDWLQRP